MRLASSIYRWVSVRIWSFSRSLSFFHVSFSVSRHFAVPSSIFLNLLFYRFSFFLFLFFHLVRSQARSLARSFVRSVSFCISLNCWPAHGKSVIKVMQDMCGNKLDFCFNILLSCISTHFCRDSIYLIVLFPWLFYFNIRVVFFSFLFFSAYGETFACRGASSKWFYDWIICPAGVRSFLWKEICIAHRKIAVLVFVVGAVAVAVAIALLVWIFALCMNWLEWIAIHRPMNFNEFP